MTRYCPFFFLFSVCIDRNKVAKVNKNAKKNSWSISCHLDQTRLVHRKFILSPKKGHFLA